MRVNEERQQLIHRRTLEIQREQQKKRESNQWIRDCCMPGDDYWNRMSDARSDKTGFCFWGKN